MMAIVQAGEDKYVDRFKALLNHGDVRVAVFVTTRVGVDRRNGYFPDLLVQALRSDRVEVVDEALSWTPNCSHTSRRSDVRQALLRIYSGDNERLKFHACFPLMHDFHEPCATDYLLDQVSSRNEERAREALCWIGDSCNYGRAPTQRQLDVLTPLLRSSDAGVRCSALGALGRYRGSVIIQKLIDSLADQDETIVHEATSKLVHDRYHDKQMAIELLDHASKDHVNPQVRQRCQAALEKLRKEQ